MDSSSIARSAHLVMEDEHMDKLYASANPAIRWFFRRRLDVMEKLLPDSPLDILDAGCGEGHLLQRLMTSRGHDRYYGIDILATPLLRARQRCPQIAFTQGDVCRLPYPDHSFDAVLCSDVLEHIPDYTLAIQEMQRVLRPGGRLIIAIPNETLWTAVRFLLGRRPVKVPDHINSFSGRRLAKLVAWPLTGQHNLPFGFPFNFSLSTTLAFRRPSGQTGI